MKSNQYKLKTRKRSLKNKKTSKVLVKKVKKTNKKGGGGNNNSVLVLAPEEITSMVGIIENAGFDYEFDEQCRDNELFQKLFNNSQPNCHMFFLELIKKVSLLKMLMDNNKKSFDLLEPRKNNRVENKEGKLASFRQRIVKKIEQQKCTTSQLSEPEKKEFVNFINKVFSIDNALNKMESFSNVLQQLKEKINSTGSSTDELNELSSNVEQFKEELQNENGNDIIEIVRKIILSGFGIGDVSKCDIGFKLFNLLKAINVLTNENFNQINPDIKERLKDECIKKVFENIGIFLEGTNFNIEQEGGAVSNSLPVNALKKIGSTFGIGLLGIGEGILRIISLRYLLSGIKHLGYGVILIAIAVISVVFFPVSLAMLHKYRKYTIQNYDLNELLNYDIKKNTIKFGSFDVRDFFKNLTKKIIEKGDNKKIYNLFINDLTFNIVLSKKILPIEFLDYLIKFFQKYFQITITTIEDLKFCQYLFNNMFIVGSTQSICKNNIDIDRYYKKFCSLPKIDFSDINSIFQHFYEFFVWLVLLVINYDDPNKNNLIKLLVNYISIILNINFDTILLNIEMKEIDNLLQFQIFGALKKKFPSDTDISLSNLLEKLLDQSSLIFLHNPVKPFLESVIFKKKLLKNHNETLIYNNSLKGQTMS